MDEGLDERLQRDVDLLTHLRGYPEELKHFSNLMKQSHPHGRSAIEFLTGRAVARPSFLDALARAARGGEAVLSAVEAAERFGVPPRRFLDEVASREGFPPPLFREEHKALWRAEDVERYLAEHG